MNDFKREGYISADISETFAGYHAWLTLTNDDGTVVYSECKIPCRTKDDAEEIVEKFLKGEYNGES